MNVGGKEGLSIQDRTRNVAELLKVLMDINEINGGTNATAEKMKLHAKNFESALFAKSSSKEEYLDSMKEKVNAMKNTRDNRKKSLANGNSNNKQNNKQNNSNNNQQQQQMQQQMQQQQMQQMQQQQQQQQNGNMNYMPNTMNMNSQMFLNQQAQARQQAQQQLKDRQQQQQIQQQQMQQQQPNQGQGQGQNQGQRQVLTPQQRQLINQMKVAPIPRELLQKIPNIPSDVNTWQQITELAQQKRLTPHDMQIAKEVYKIHQQLLYKSKIQQVNANSNAINMQQQQQQQAKQQQMQQQMQQQQMQQQQMQQRQKDQQMGNSNNDGNNNNNNGNNNNSNNNNIGNNQPMFRNRNGEVPNVLGQINQIFTPDEQRALLQEAMEACKTFQKTQFGANMTDANRQSFIRKYINQKALKKIQSTRMAQQAAAAAQQQANQNDNTANNNSNTNMNMNDSQNNNNNNNNSNNNNNVNVGNNGSNMQNMAQQNRNTPISQQQIQAQQAQQRSMPSSQGHQRTNSSQKASMLQLLQPTPQDIETVRKISTDAARTPLRLNDLTNVISPQEKDEIKRKLQMNQQLFAQVSNYAPQVYVFTKSEAFLKEVLQLRIFVKEILDKCSKGIYVVKLDTVDKLIMKYQKYWESMKIQILRRQQLIQQQQQLIRQKQQQNQQQPSGNNTPINSIPTPVQNNANMVQQQQRMTQNQRAQSQNRQMQQQQQQMQWQQQQQLQQQMNSSNNNTPQMNNSYVQMNGGNMPNANVMNAKLNSRQPSVPIPPNAIMPNDNDNMMGQMPGSQFNTTNATPDLGKINSRNTSVPTSNQVSPSREKTGTSNGTTKAANSKKPSPSTSASSKNAKSLSNVPTPRLNNNATTATAARSPGQKTTPQSIGADQRMKSNVETNPVFKKEEDELQSLNIKKTEISSRFKHRQEAFQTSSLDLFLSTLSDTLGLKDDEYEPQMKFSQDFIGLTNRTGKKKKLTKVAQRARERDPVDVMIVDGKKMVMKSKYMLEKNKIRNYGIKLSSISSIFNGLENNICEKLNDLAFIDTPLNNTDCNTKKRKLDEMNLTPDSIKSNVNDSPSIMSESKRIKFDSPEDTYVATDGKLKKGANEINFNNATATASDFSTLTNGTTDDKKEINIWDWDYWANKV